MLNRCVAVGARVRLINVAGMGICKAWKFHCCAVHSMLNFEGGLCCICQIALDVKSGFQFCFGIDDWFLHLFDPVTLHFG
ncbi:hypothetical protein T4A_6605 [Trichinella pseudospiralis]|uniref:Uncharacterized protein n=1 Tax=Trichinella pseudospiralis TaxID=6337 RepID=A0A0V1D5I6_TRIPS|nr:hypothetical protein T4A_6605 [Trichinella pseudospiralis]